MATGSPFRLKSLLHRVVVDRTGESDITELARVAYTIASTRLRQLMSQGRLHLQSFQIPLESVAFDCIAELFERNDDGVFVELRDYFSEDRDLAVLEEAEVVHYFRGLVFTSVTDGIFRMYHEHDPILAKILRNLKIAIRRSPHLRFVNRFGSVHVSSSSAEDDARITVLSLDDLEHQLSRALRPGSPMQNITVVVESIVKNGGSEQCILTILDLAVALKRIAARGEMQFGAVAVNDTTLLTDDIKRIVHDAEAVALQELHENYVVKHKVTDQLFASYSHAISDILRDTFIRNDGSELSQVQYLQRYLKGLEWEEYRTRHRAQFEYMVRKAKRLVQKELRELL